MNILSLEQILAVHALVIQATGGDSNLRDLNRLEAVVATHAQHVFDEELYPTHYHKSAALIRGIIADHPFIDGNKRTGMLVGLTFLSINKAELKLLPHEIENLAVDIAVKHLDISDIAIWLQKHTK